MKKEALITILFIAVLLLPAAGARNCEAPTAHIKETARFCGSNYQPKYGISIEADNIIVDCGNAVMQGNIQKGEFSGTGISVISRKNVTIKNCKVVHYNTGILVKNSAEITVIDSSLIRNKIGLKLVNSQNNFFERNNDISIEKPVIAVNATNNIINCVNKNLEGDFCRTNICNEESDIIVEAEEQKHQKTEKGILLRSLRDSIRMFLHITKPAQ